MTSAVETTLTKLSSMLKGMGMFASVAQVEPKGAPGSGLTCAVFLNTIFPAAAASGLNAATGYYVYTIRIYTNMLQEPVEKIDTILAHAVDKVFTALMGDCDLGANVRNIDVFGELGTQLKAVAGYVDVDKVMYRSVDITLPLILNDVWTLSA